MNHTLQVSMIIAVVIYFGLLVHFLKRQRLNLKYSLLWLFSGIVMLVLALFPQLLNKVSALLGIYSPVNALFAIIFFCIIIILMSLTAIVSKLNDRVTRLTQSLALLDKRVRNDEKE